MAFSESILSTSFLGVELKYKLPFVHIRLIARCYTIYVLWMKTVVMFVVVRMDAFAGK